MFSNIRNHFRNAANNIRLIEREKLILDRTKIVPDIILDQLPVWPKGPSSLFHYTLYRNHSRAAVHRFNRVAAGETDLYAAFHGRANPEYADQAREFFEFYMTQVNAALKGTPVFDQMAEGAEQIRAGMDDGSFMHLCRPVGDWLEGHEATGRDEGLKRLIKMASYMGSGGKVLEFWKTLNAIPDWRPFAEKMEIIGGPPRRKKELPKERKDLAWQPAAVGSPA